MLMIYLQKNIFALWFGFRLGKASVNMLCRLFTVWSLNIFALTVVIQYRYLRFWEEFKSAHKSQLEIKIKEPISLTWTEKIQRCQKESSVHPDLNKTRLSPGNPRAVWNTNMWSRILNSCYSLRLESLHPSRTSKFSLSLLKIKLEIYGTPIFSSWSWIQ